MVRKKMTTYVDEDLLRSAKVLAARRNGKIYEVFEEALRRYLEEPGREEVRRAVREEAREALEEQPGAERGLELLTYDSSLVEAARKEDIAYEPKI